MLVTYDERKREANLDKHGLDFASVTEGFFEAASVVEAKAGRYMAIGSIDGVTASLVFRPLGAEAFALISLRRASKKERDRP